ncbi:MAG: hypothetical protein PW791_17905 [Neorhizobium sp.]|jgi:hypothetical protein|nr:hypothetical protein [Neorhizobium sp.]
MTGIRKLMLFIGLLLAAGIPLVLVSLCRVRDGSALAAIPAGEWAKALMFSVVMLGLILVVARSASREHRSHRKINHR